ncbi:uncharacterized protein DNG_03540 [Cephalotrichum gorgonifer]|uniref:Heterokaryon incompatibility domain-containing protein n=1 Tax=Cephalotrichum gorgonifer TaxID=2041049 RepID=A0AAE8SU34_9PEZI|nr:uncharacterized protein DNG_03540 [Cephalotrichum gorgonifer]
MRLLNSYTLDFHEFENGSCPPYAILSHTWGGEEVLHRDMTWLQEYCRLYEPDDQSSQEKKKPQGKDTEAGPSAAGSSKPGERTLPDEDDEECPAYGEVEETSTEDQSTARAIRARQGYQKILKIAEHCRVSQIGYFWIDTCCIDKSNGFEVSEAVLSAYQWYKEATVCFMYLSDVPSTDPLADPDSVFRRSWWFTRGWTLIELLAPTARVWFDQDWNFIFPDTRLIYEITGIDTGYLEGADPSIACVAKRMSWAAHRNTTRREDVAYCLLGLFDISMPILYGEGAEKAFMRLQRKILKTTVDTSIFAWGYEAPILTDSVRILATSPDEFSGCRTLRRAQNVAPMNDYFLLGPRGLEYRSDVAQCRTRDPKLWDGHFGLVMNEIYDDAAPEHRLYIPLMSLNEPSTADGTRTILKRLCGSRPVRILPKNRKNLTVHPRRSFFFRSERTDATPVVNVLFTPSLSALPFKLVEVFPPQMLVPSHGGFVTPYRLAITNVHPPTVIFLRYEENAPGAHSRRFVVVLQYTGIRERASSFELTSSKVSAVDITNSKLISLCDEFLERPEKAKPHFWSGFFSSVPIGDTLVSTSVDMDSERWDLMRLHVRTAPLGSTADGVVTGEALVAMAGARGHGERMRTPFD